MILVEWFFGEASRGTPADARLVPESGVVYGANILRSILTLPVNNTVLHIVPYAIVLYSGLRPSLYARGK